MGSVAARRPAPGASSVADVLALFIAQTFFSIRDAWRRSFLSPDDRADARAADPAAVRRDVHWLWRVRRRTVPVILRHESMPG